MPSPTLLRNRPRLRIECRKVAFKSAGQRGQWFLKGKPGVFATMSRSYNDELQFLEKISKNCWRIKKGFVPNMQVRRWSRARGWGSAAPPCPPGWASSNPSRPLARGGRPRPAASGFPLASTPSSPPAHECFIRADPTSPLETSQHGEGEESGMRSAHPHK